MPRQFRVELPLRVALVAATLLLVACGLTASGIAVTSILRQHLIQRADQTLEEASRGWAQAPKGALKVPHGANLDRPPIVLIMSGGENVESLFETGRAVLIKPFEGSELRDLVSGLLHEPPRPRPAA